MWNSKNPGLISELLIFVNQIRNGWQPCDQSEEFL